ncbi:MAG TPA: hypothetical protein VG944_10890 [Fimbriimonas sp.]|nr:hypothetical protein [Fimbriimonas sp.]
MKTLIAVHEVENPEHWAHAWRQGPGGRHEMFATIGVTARTFRDPRNAHLTGLILEVPDLDRFEAFIRSPEGIRAMQEDGIRPGSLRILAHFSPQVSVMG